MTKRVFEIDWADNLGPLWMNKSNLLICLTAYCRNSVFTVRDVTGDGACDTSPETAGPLSRTEIETAYSGEWVRD